MATGVGVPHAQQNNSLFIFKINDMKRKIVFIFCLWVQSICLFAQPPTNAIFQGGAGDGWSEGSFALAGANIFKGRIGDGWSSQGNNLAANTIFKGVRGDGWNFSSFSIVSNSIYKGGKSDGWIFANFSIASNAIYKGCLLYTSRCV